MFQIYGYADDADVRMEQGDIRGYMDGEIRVQLEGPAAEGMTHEVECNVCGWGGDFQDRNEEDGEFFCPECDGQELVSRDGVDQWLNSAAITMKDGEVTVSLSLGDPRGAFTMTARKLPDGRIVLHVPYPEAGTLHMPLRELHPGTYEVG